jgi:flagellar biogenesis protein FliO
MIPFFISVLSVVDYQSAIIVNNTAQAQEHLTTLSNITSGTAEGHVWTFFAIAMYFVLRLIQTLIYMIRDGLNSVISKKR